MPGDEFPDESETTKISQNVVYELRFPYNTRGCVSTPSYARVLLCVDCPSLCHGCVCRAPSIPLRIKSHSLRSPDSPHSPHTCGRPSRPLLGASSCFSHRMDYIELRDVLILGQPLPSHYPAMDQNTSASPQNPWHRARPWQTCPRSGPGANERATGKQRLFLGTGVPRRGGRPETRGCISIDTVREDARVSRHYTGSEESLPALGVHALAAASSHHVRTVMLDSAGEEGLVHWPV